MLWTGSPKKFRPFRAPTNEPELCCGDCCAVQGQQFKLVLFNSNLFNFLVLFKLTHLSLGEGWVINTLALFNMLMAYYPQWCLQQSGSKNVSSMMSWRTSFWNYTGYHWIDQIQKLKYERKAFANLSSGIWTAADSKDVPGTSAFAVNWSLETNPNEIHHCSGGWRLLCCFGFKGNSPDICKRSLECIAHSGCRSIGCKLRMKIEYWRVLLHEAGKSLNQGCQSTTTLALLTCRSGSHKWSLSLFGFGICVLKRWINVG